MLVHLKGILARYIVKNLLIPFLCCLIGFLFLILIAKIHNDLPDLSGKIATSEIIWYFIYIIPTYINDLIPMSLLLGAMYCFANLSRNNEITAIRTAGISLYKIAAPSVIVALILGLFIFINNEYILPKANLITLAIEAKAKSPIVKSHSITYIKRTDKGRRSWVSTIEKGEIINVTLHQFDLEGLLEWEIQATSATYDDGVWTFVNGSTAKYINNSAEARDFFKSKSLSLDEHFNNITTEKIPTSYNSISQISNTLNNTENLKSSKKQKLKTSLTYLTFVPFAPLIAIFLGLPLSITHNRKAAIASFAQVIPLMFLYFITTKLFLRLGYIGTISPFIAGALPTITFLVCGAYIMYKRR